MKDLFVFVALSAFVVKTGQSVANWETWLPSEAPDDAELVGNYHPTLPEWKVSARFLIFRFTASLRVQLTVRIYRRV